jgi:hypothetical protein
MKTANDECAKLRNEIAKRKTSRSRLEPELRERCARYAATRRAAGAKTNAIATELGVSEMSVARWLRIVPRAAMVPIRVVEAAPRSILSGVVVITPSGLRVEGLELDALCTVIARVG